MPYPTHTLPYLTLPYTRIEQNRIEYITLQCIALHYIYILYRYNIISWIANHLLNVAISKGREDLLRFWKPYKFVGLVCMDTQSLGDLSKCLYGTSPTFTFKIAPNVQFLFPPTCLFDSYRGGKPPRNNQSDWLVDS